MSPQTIVSAALSRRHAKSRPEPLVSRKAATIGRGIALAASSSLFVP
jgi:hypothetical protein